MCSDASRRSFVRASAGRGATRELEGERVSGVSEIRVGRDARNQPELVRSGCVDRLARGTGVRSRADHRAGAAGRTSLPVSGDAPRLTNAVENVASSDATTRSHASASGSPAPCAPPRTSAITGFGRRLIATITLVQDERDVAQEALGLTGRRGGRHLLDVAAGAGDAPSASEDHDANVAGSRSLVLESDFEECPRQRAVGRIQAIRPIESDLRDAIPLASRERAGPPTRTAVVMPPSGSSRRSDPTRRRPDASPTRAPSTWRARLAAKLR